MKRSPMKRRPRPSTPAERAWYAKVHRIENCVLCGRYGIQVAHRNEGAGMGRKVAAEGNCAALCPICHYYIDDGPAVELSERRALMNKAINETNFLLEMMG